MPGFGVSCAREAAGIKKTADGFTYLDAAQFHELFAADLPAEQAVFMSRSQVFNFADNFKAVITNAAWRSKPSWMLVAGDDMVCLLYTSCRSMRQRDTCR